MADAVGSTHGVTRTLEQIRERGVPGFEVEVIGTDPNVDRRLSAVAEIDVPFYAGLEVGVPSLPAIVDALAEGRYDLVHLPTPGPSGVAAALVARVMDLPIVGSYHTELAAYAALRTGDGSIERAMSGGAARLLRAVPRGALAEPVGGRVAACPGHPGRAHRRAGTAASTSGASIPTAAWTGAFTGEVNVLYAGRLTHEKGADLLADAFLAARERDPRLHLVLAGGGPEEESLRERLGVDATFLGWLEGDELARAYASADLFLFASRTDTFGQVILEAQASGLPVVAVAEGGPLELVDDGRTGRLCAPEAGALAAAVVELAANPALRRRLGRAGAAATTARTWERALAQLSAGYGRALGAVPSVEIRRAA